MKKIFSKIIMLLCLTAMVCCSNESLVKGNEILSGTDRKSMINEQIPDNQVIVRDYERNYNASVLLNRVRSGSRGEEDQTDDDFLVKEAAAEFENFYASMPDDVKTEFDKACDNGDVKISYDYITTLELDDMSELTSDYIQAKIAEGEMIKEIESAFGDEEIVIECLIPTDEIPENMFLYNDEGNESRGSRNKILKYKKYSSSRGELSSQEEKVKAKDIALLMAFMNCQEDVNEIANLIKTRVDINKIRKYQQLMNKKQANQGRGSSKGYYYEKSLIDESEFTNKLESDSIIKTGQIICTLAKEKSSGCIYGIFNHAGIIDLRSYIGVNKRVNADLWTKTVLSAYPKSCKDSLLGDRMPEKLGYPSFEPIINFTQGADLAILEPFDKTKMKPATEYVVSRKNKCNKEYNLIDSYCSYMPYYGYLGVGIDLNSDQKNQFPNFDQYKQYAPIMFSIAAACCGPIKTPEDIYYSHKDQYGKTWIKVWIPTYCWKFFRTGAWWQGDWKWVESGGYYAWRYRETKLYSKTTQVVVERHQ